MNTPPPAFATAPDSTLAARRIDAVVIGASAGGLEALLRLLSPLPAGYALPVVVLLHLPDGRQSRLTEIFRHRFAMRVVEAVDKQPLAPSTVHVAPSGDHLLIERDRSFSFTGEAPVSYSRPSIDVLMASAADAYGPRLAGILLTGANLDGALGLAAIGEAGGLTVVQDPAEAQVPTMPLAAIARRAPDRVLPLEQIHSLLLTLGAQR